MALSPAPARTPVHIRPVDDVPGLALVKGLLQAYRDWLGPQHHSPRLDRELANLPGDYAPPRGCLLLATRAGMAVGCIGLCQLRGEEAELKRLFVTAPLRRQGIARALLGAATQEAAACGYRALLLDMVPGMDAAASLYASVGFRDIPAYYPGTRHAHRFMRLELRGPGPGP